MAHIADGLKEKGNALFKSGDYAGAEEQYTLAIQRYSRNPLLFTNRAFSRLKLQRWEGAIDDCLHSIDLTGQAGNFKAWYYLGRYVASITSSRSPPHCHSTILYAPWVISNHRKTHFHSFEVASVYVTVDSSR